MKKRIALLLILVLTAIMLPAHALELGQGVTLDVNGMELADVLDDRESGPAQDWLVTNVTLMNWKQEPVRIEDVLDAELVFADSYRFDGQLLFDVKEAGMLLALDGRIAFLLPNIVCDNLRDSARMVIDVDGSAQSPEMKLGGTRVRAVRFEGDGFDSPEAALKAYVEAFGDAQAMLSTFAVESYVEHYNEVSNLERLKAFQPALFISCYPVDNSYADGLKLYLRVSDITNGWRNQYLLYDLPEEYGSYGGRALSLYEEGAVNAFVDAVSVEKLSSMLDSIAYVRPVSISMIDEHAAKKAMSENNLRNLLRQRDCFGCDELSEQIALIEVDGEPFYQFMQCGRYGDRWYNLVCQSNYALLVDLNAFSSGLMPASES